MIRKTLLAVLRRDRFEAGLDDELRHHLESRAADLMRSGLSAEAAARQARIEMGSRERYKDEARASFGLRWLDDLRHDVRFAVRTLRRSPGFTLAAILSMALGISANTVVFSMVNSLLLRPLPVAAPEQIFFVNNGDSTSFSYPTYRDLRDRVQTAAGTILVRFSRLAIGDELSAEKHWGYLASGNYFDVLGLQPAAGRFFHAEDEKGGPNSAPYVVLSYNLWQSGYSGNPAIVGQTVRVNALPYTVLGVAPEGFRGTEVAVEPAVWIPVMMQPQIEGNSWLEQRADRNSWVMVRAKTGVSKEAIEADLNRIVTDLTKEYPTVERGTRVILSEPGLFGTTLRGPIAKAGAGVLFLGGLVLLAACVNLASLLAARASDRFREIALRVSIGAGRGRIVRQLLTESTVLTVVAGTVGVAFAWVSVRALSQWRPSSDIPLLIDVQLDLRVLAFSAGVSVLTGILAGVAPALEAWRINTSAALKGTHSRLRRWNYRDASLFAQTAVCCLLVVSSLVAARGVSNVFNARPGLNPDGVSVVSFDTLLAGYSTPDSLRFQRKALDQVRSLPGVSIAAYANSLPLNTDQSNTRVFPEDSPEPRRLDQGWQTAYYYVSPGYFRTMGTRLLAGREFSWGETDARVAIVNETFARRMFQTADAVGKRFRYFGGPPVEVVGVVEDGKYFTFSEDPRPVVFRQAIRNVESETTLLVRTSRDEFAVAQEMMRAVNALDPSVPVYGVHSLRANMALTMLPAEIALGVLGTFGILAVMLAVTGIYGLASYCVSRRVREIGIRMALGARPPHILETVLGRLGIVVGLGALTGLALGAMSGDILAAVVYQATPRDPATLGGVAILMAMVAVASALGPIRRAIAIQPVQALRED